MSLDDSWAQELDNVALTYLYRTLNRLIEGNRYRDFLPSKGEQDTAWAVKYEYERRRDAGEGVF